MHRRMLVIEDSKEDFVAIMRALNRDGLKIKVVEGTADDDIADEGPDGGWPESNASVGVIHSESGDGALQNMLAKIAGGDIARLPQVILLDLNLPGTDGREILTELKSNELLKRIPVVVLTTSTNPRDVVECYDKGAAGYCAKGGDGATFSDTIEAIKKFWLYAAILPKRADGR